MMSSNKILTIDSLCEDVLLLIFDKYLDFRSQLKTRIVCRRFRDLIDGLFNSKRALCLTEELKTLYDISDEDLSKYPILSVRDLCRLQDGFWVRGSDNALRLLQPLHIQMLVLRKHKHLTALCLVLRSRTSLESLIDLILNNCSSNLEKLIVLNLNGQHFSITDRQMEALCDQYSNLKHLEIFSDYLYASEESFAYLLSRCKSLEVFKLSVRQVFSERIESLGTGGSRSVTYNSFKFEGFSFAQMSGHLTTIYASNPILTDSVIVNKLPEMADHFLNVKHLSIERLSPNGMESICDIFKSLESLSFSMSYAIESDAKQIKSLINCINQLQHLRQLSIRWFGETYTKDTVPLDYNTLKGLNNCSHLKRLTIKDAVIGEDTLKDINILFPSLECLHIYNCGLSTTSFGPIDGFNELQELIIFKSYSQQIFRKFRFLLNEMTVNSVRITEECIDCGLIDSVKPDVEPNIQPNEDLMIEPFDVPYDVPPAPQIDVIDQDLFEMMEENKNFFMFY